MTPLLDERAEVSGLHRDDLDEDHRLEVELPSVAAAGAARPAAAVTGALAQT